MTLKAYEHINFTPARLDLIRRANTIVEQYEKAGYVMTVRQLYYQLVTKNFIDNTPTSYDRLVNAISDARLNGLISWRAIEDRLRGVMGNHYFTSPGHALKSVRETYQLDKWATQPCRVEVHVEKDAMSAVVGSICMELGVDFMVLRGYASQSSLWRAGQRYLRYIGAGQRPIVLHLGDHDPSGLDMTRDNQRRLSMFAGTQIFVSRIALNWDQIEELKPPPNPAKRTDSRHRDYIEKYGESSYELDALSPEFIHDLIERHVKTYRDDAAWGEALTEEAADLRVLDDLIATLPADPSSTGP